MLTKFHRPPAGGQGGFVAVVKFVTSNGGGPWPERRSPEEAVGWVVHAS